MSVMIYKNRVFKIDDVIDISIYDKTLKVELNSFSDVIKESIEKKENRTHENKNVDITELLKTEEESGNWKPLWKYNADELKCVYFFFLVNLLRYKNEINAPLIDKMCQEINNIQSLDTNFDVNYGYDEGAAMKNNRGISLNLQRFLVKILEKCKESNLQLRQMVYDSSITMNIEKCGVMLYYIYKIASCSKFITCSLFHCFELFQIDCGVLFDNSVNNNFNNSNIASINNLIANIKWLIHDSKITKDRKRSEEFEADIFLFVQFQSKILDECDYFFNMVNTNLKNSLNVVHWKNSHSTVAPMDCYLNMYAKVISEYLKVYIEGLLSIVKKVIPAHLEGMKVFICKNEIVEWDSTANLKGPPFGGFFTKPEEGNINKKDATTNKDGINTANYCESGFSKEAEKITKSLKTQYMSELKDIEKRYSEISNMKEIQQMKEFSDMLNQLAILLSHINILANMMNDIVSYNAAVKKFQKKKKVTSSEYNIGIGCQDFKHFLYSFIEKKNSIERQLQNNEWSNTNGYIKEAKEIAKENKNPEEEIEKISGEKSLLVTDVLLSFLKKKVKPYKYMEEVNAILTAKNINFNFKTPKGTKDYNGEQMQLRNIFFDYIKNKFLLNGAVEIDTPVFELKETLTNKYGEDSKLIYDLKDQGGENLALRYDLTVPLCRFFNTNKLSQLKCFHIGKVYRRDEPNMNKGRYREFYQCDFDIIGKYDKVKTDFHILIMFTDILKGMEKTIGGFICKINHRSVLEYILISSNIRKDKLKTVSSSIDKLDKITFEQFREELISVKGIPETSVDTIEKYIKATKELPTVYDVVHFLKEDVANCFFDDAYKKKVLDVLNHMKEIFDLLTHYEIISHFRFDLSLARGLDYYTGIIFEYVLVSEKNVGSIAAGGRYDELVKNTRAECVPAVGASVGIERIITIAEQYLKETEEKKTQDTTAAIADDVVAKQSKEKLDTGVLIKDNMVNVLVCIIHNEYFKEAITICKRLWQNNIGAEFVYAENPKIQKQIVYALEKQIPLVLIIGDEVKQGNVRIKDLRKNKNQTENEKEVNVLNCVEVVKSCLEENLSWQYQMKNILFNMSNKKFAS